MFTLILRRYGMTSHRKAQKSSNPYYPQDDEDEDKYRRKGFMQLFAALGLVYAYSLSFPFTFTHCPCVYVALSLSLSNLQY